MCVTLGISLSQDQWRALQRLARSIDEAIGLVEDDSVDDQSLQDVPERISADTNERTIAFTVRHACSRHSIGVLTLSRTIRVALCSSRRSGASRSDTFATRCSLTCASSTTTTASRSLGRRALRSRSSSGARSARRHKRSRTPRVSSSSCVRHCECRAWSMTMDVARKRVSSRLTEIQEEEEEMAAVNVCCGCERRVTAPRVGACSSDPLSACRRQNAGACGSTRQSMALHYCCSHLPLAALTETTTMPSLAH